MAIYNISNILNGWNLDNQDDPYARLLPRGHYLRQPRLLSRVLQQQKHHGSRHDLLGQSLLINRTH